MNIPANLSRAPTLLTSQLFLSNLTRTNLSMLDLQTQMVTGRTVNRPSDDAVAASAIAVLKDRLERADQRMSNLSSADTALSLLDVAVGEANELVLRAKSLASSQIGTGSDSGTRRNQAIVVDSLIRQLFDLGNRSTNGVYVFGGSTPTSPPIREVNGGFRYVGRGSGLITDLGVGEGLPVTLGGDNAIGETSVRLRSTADLNPGLTPDTRLDDVHGARGLGVARGVIAFSFNGGAQATVDLTGAETAQDTVDALTAAIRRYEADNTITALGPGGVSISGGSVRIDVAGGGGGGDPQLVFSDVGAGVTAQDLGLTDTPFDVANPDGADLDPKLTLLTPLSALPGIPFGLGTVRFRFTTGTTAAIRDVDLSAAETIGDIRSAIETGVPGVRVEIGDGGRGINIHNEVAGPSLSIEDVPGDATATQLGIRSLTPDTPLSDFNDGRGIGIVTGATDPTTGLPDPPRDVDFTIRLGNGASFPVDLRPQDIATAQTVIDRINAQAADAVTAGLIPAGSFIAGLAEGRNGIAFSDLQNLGPIGVARANNSPAAGDLGLLGGVYTPAGGGGGGGGGATFVAQDRSGVRVDNLFTTLIGLRDALLADDSTGITVAGEGLERGIDRLASSRALVGVHANRVEAAVRRQEDQIVTDERLRSELQDLDFTHAAVRLNQLQTQLLAGMQSAAAAQSRTLLDFLG